MIRKQHFIQALTLGLFPLLLPNIAQAQVGLSPLIIESKLDKGKAEGVITVSNPEKETFRARVYPELFIYDPELGFKTIPSDQSSIVPYLQFSPRELEVPGNKERKVRVIIRTPPSLPDGEYRAVIFTENLKQSDIKQGQLATAVVARIGTVVFIRKGNVSPKLTVDSIKYNSQKKILELIVKNSGTATGYGAINWKLKQGSQEITNGVFPKVSTSVNSQRNMMLQYPNKADQPSLKPGKYQLTGELSWKYPELSENKNTVPFTVDFDVPVELKFIEQKAPNTGK
jgi:hypothetical protein